MTAKATAGPSEESGVSIPLEDPETPETSENFTEEVHPVDEIRDDADNDEYDMEMELERPDPFHAAQVREASQNGFPPSMQQFGGVGVVDVSGFLRAQARFIEANTSFMLRQINLIEFSKAQHEFIAAQSAVLRGMGIL